MNRLKKAIALLILLLSCSYTNYAQNTSSSQERKTIIVFIPLEIDGAFNGTDYILGNNNLPKTMLPGLDFYNGVLMAVDSLKKSSATFDIRIIDTKQKNNSLTTLLTDSGLQKPALIISAVTNKADTKLIADFALAQQTPMVSAVFPSGNSLKFKIPFAIPSRIFQTNRNPIAKADLFTKIPKNKQNEKKPSNFTK